MIALLPVVVHWSDHGYPCSLECHYRNDPEGGRIIVKLSSGIDGDRTAVETTLSGVRWDVVYALPIRVMGQSEPEVLTRVQRPNWLDYTLYNIREEGLSRGFSVSVRDPRAIRWDYRKGALRSFTVFDRWHPTSQKMLDHEPRGKRWQYVTRWRFVSGRWAHGSGRWSTYAFGTSPAGQDFDAKRCPFAY